MSKLYYEKPAGWDFNQALPIGNGKLGAMIFANEDMEHYQLNEDSLWSGEYNYRVNPDAKDNLEKVRELIFDGKISEAELLLKHSFTAMPQGTRVYQTAGDMYADFMNTITEPVDYKRELDLEKAVHSVSVKDKKSEKTFFRKAFASKKYNVLATKFSSDSEKSVSVGVTISRKVFYDRSWREDDMVFFEGEQSGVSFCAGVTAVSDGDTYTLGEHVITKNVDSACVYVTIATSIGTEADPVDTVRKTLEEAKKVSFDQMLEEHLIDYKGIFDECKLELPYDKDLDEVPTDERLLKEEIDLGLVKTYFDYGRYLLISSSRPGSLPANLQGIWNDSMDPAWGSKYTININAQMNYWPAEMLGMSECHLPLFDLLKKMHPNGKKVAMDMYGCRGFVAHHNTDCHGDCAPQDMYNPATYWVMGGAWLCTHAWNHYIYTMDKDFLKEMYPIFKDAVLFFHDFLVEKDGYLVTCPSESPENTYILPSGEKGCIGYGVTMDNEILRDLFEQFIKASKVLGIEDSFVQKTRDILSKIAPIRVGSKGQILEWIDEYEEDEPGHRHISHLYALHPSSQITKDKTPKLCEAAKKTLEMRLSEGGGHTGWSRAWIINMYARLGDSNNAYKNLVLLLKKSTLPNLFDNHPPFQIDGNFGGTAGIGEMLLQSNEERTVILPACPKEFASGSINGIRGVGGVIYDFSWQNNKVTELVVTAKEAVDLKLYVNEKVYELQMEKGEKKTIY